MSRPSYSEGNFDTLSSILFLGIVVVAFILLTIAGMGRFENSARSETNSQDATTTESVDIGG